MKELYACVVTCCILWHCRLSTFFHRLYTKRPIFNKMLLKKWFFLWQWINCWGLETTWVWRHSCSFFLKINMKNVNSNYVSLIQIWCMSPKKVFFLTLIFFITPCVIKWLVRYYLRVYLSLFIIKKTTICTLL